MFQSLWNCSINPNDSGVFRAQFVVVFHVANQLLDRGGWEPNHLGPLEADIVSVCDFVQCVEELRAMQANK